jgi:hypothetical protein
VTSITGTEMEEEMEGHKQVILSLPNLKFFDFIKGVLVVSLLVFLSLASLVLANTWSQSRGPVQVIATQPLGNTSPYVCFSAVRKENVVLAMNCLDITLTDSAVLQTLLSNANVEAPSNENNPLNSTDTLPRPTPTPAP